MKKNSPTSKTGILSLAFFLLSSGAVTVQSGRWREGGTQVLVGVALIFAYEYLQAQQIEETFVKSFIGDLQDDNEE